MSFNRQHILLVRAADGETCLQRVERFFARNPLVQYDRVEVRRENALPATAAGFQDALTAALAENAEAVAALVAELKGVGVATVEDLARLPQGYPSKALHTLAHFVDGFFGIDTVFYNLEDDSHAVPASTLRHIADAPGQFWLVTVKAFFADAGADRLPSFRHIA